MWKTKTELFSAPIYSGFIWLSTSRVGVWERKQYRRHGRYVAALFYINTHPNRTFHNFRGSTSGDRLIYGVQERHATGFVVQKLSKGRSG